MMSVMKTQNEIAHLLGVTQPAVNPVLTGKRPLSWKMAERMADLFPGKSLAEWRRATPEQIKKAFASLSVVD
jgi:plasmid maintenance system antidote protein VapI